MDMSNSAHNRQSRRSPVFLSASLEDNGRQLSVILRNMSEHGALVEGDRLPDEGADIFFERKEIRVKARVVWVHLRYAGVAFNRELQREELLRSVPPPRAAKTDVNSRRPGFVSKPLTAGERKVLDIWMTQIPTIGPKS
jgi:hypothetical protein